MSFTIGPELGPEPWRAFACEIARMCAPAGLEGVSVDSLKAHDLPSLLEYVSEHMRPAVKPTPIGEAWSVPVVIYPDGRRELMLKEFPDGRRWFVTPSEIGSVERRRSGARVILGEGDWIAEYPVDESAVDIRATVAQLKVERGGEE